MAGENNAMVTKTVVLHSPKSLDPLGISAALGRHFYVRNFVPDVLHNGHKVALSGMRSRLISKHEELSKLLSKGKYPELYGACITKCNERMAAYSSPAQAAGKSGRAANEHKKNFVRLRNFFVRERKKYREETGRASDPSFVGRKLASTAKTDGIDAVVVFDTRRAGGTQLCICHSNLPQYASLRDAAITLFNSRVSFEFIEGSGHPLAQHGLPAVVVRGTFNSLKGKINVLADVLGGLFNSLPPQNGNGGGGVGPVPRPSTRLDNGHY